MKKGMEKRNGIKGRIVFCCACILLLLAGLPACSCASGTQGETEEQTFDWQEQLDLGIRLLDEGKYEEAVLAFTAVLEIDPRNAEAYSGRAEANMRWAQAAVESGQENWDENYDALWQRYDQARSDYYAALELDPENLSAYQNAVHICTLLADEEGALAILQQGLDVLGRIEELVQLAAELGYEVDENGQIIVLTEEESVAALPWEEQMDYYLDKEEEHLTTPLFAGNVELFGQDTQTITLEGFRDLAISGGWDEDRYLTVDSFYDGAGRLYRMVRYNNIAPSSISNVRAFQDQEYIDEGHTCFQQATFGYTSYSSSGMEVVRERVAAGTSLGMLGLNAGDSLETALAKLGIEDAARIAQLMMEQEREGSWVSWRSGYSAAEEETLPAGAKVYDYCAIRLELNTTAVGEEERFLEITITPYYKTEEGGTEDYGSQAILSFSAPDYCLWGLHIINE